MVSTDRDRTLVSAGTLDCRSPRDLVDSVSGWFRAADWPTASVEMDHSCRGGFHNFLLLYARRHAGGDFRRRMVACLCFVHAARFAQTLAISRTFLLSVLLCNWRSVFACRRNMASGFTTGFATGGISRTHRIAHGGSILLRAILVFRTFRADLWCGPRKPLGASGWVRLCRP